MCVCVRGQFSLCFADSVPAQPSLPSDSAGREAPSSGQTLEKKPSTELQISSLQLRRPSALPNVKCCFESRGKSPVAAGRCYRTPTAQKSLQRGLSFLQSPFCPPPLPQAPFVCFSFCLSRPQLAVAMLRWRAAPLELPALSRGSDGSASKTATETIALTPSPLLHPHCKVEGGGETGQCAVYRHSSLLQRAPCSSRLYAGDVVFAFQLSWFCLQGALCACMCTCVNVFFFFPPEQSPDSNAK